jgi:parvulin-like peptidyl-prolyl isomerase
MTFLTIDNQPLSLEQSLSYLKTAGDLPKFVLEIAQQYVLEKEIVAAGIVEPDLEVVEQLILEFRIQQQLTAAETFAQWLNSQGITFSDFHRKVALGVQLNTLKVKVTEPDLASYFLENQTSLDRVVLSRIVVETVDLATDLKAQLEQQASDFSQLARQHSIAAEAIVGGLMGVGYRGQLSEGIRASIDAAQLGQIVGPLAIEGRFWLMRVDQILPAVLEGETKLELQNHLFKRWLTEKLQNTQIQMAQMN